MTDGSLSTVLGGCGVLAHTGVRFMNQGETNRPQNRLEKRVNAALPLRVTYWDQEMKSRLAMACTYDISAHGARLTMVPGIRGVGEILTIEQGRTKACCRVVWVDGDNTERPCQMGIQCIDPGITLWEAELRHLQELYDRMVPDGLLGSMNWTGSLRRDRRRYHRFPLPGPAELLRQGLDAESVAADLNDLSRFGCRLTSRAPMLPGTDLNLSLNLPDYDLRLKGRVLRASKDLSLGIEFREIRKGDRQFLDYLLENLNRQARATKPIANAADNAA